jgi:pyruvate dehydrogenase E2 component (dihydrolipoamide acetyltransferase)
MSSPSLQSFAEFGPIELEPLSRLQKLASRVLTSNWAGIPHVTHQDQADVTVLEQHRGELNRSRGEVRISPLPFIIKAVVSALRVYPRFNASLDTATDTVILKHYFHIGFATNTPQGLLVPVIHDCDRKDIETLAGNIAELSSRARTQGLPMKDLSGGCFTISSLGALGGLGFTPIINAPEVAILGIGRTAPVARPDVGGGIEWRQMMPLSLSYDHRLINGVDAGSFMQHMIQKLADPRALVG